MNKLKSMYNVHERTYGMIELIIFNHDVVTKIKSKEKVKERRKKTEIFVALAQLKQTIDEIP